MSAPGNTLRENAKGIFTKWSNQSHFEFSFKKWRSWHLVHHFTQIDGERMETVTDFIFLGSKITADHNLSHEIKRSLFLQRKAMAKLGSILKSRDMTLPTKAHIVSYGFSSSHVWMWELDHNKDRVPKNWCFWTVVLEKTFQGQLDSKDIKSVNPKGNQH